MSSTPIRVTGPWFIKALASRSIAGNIRIGSRKRPYQARKGPLIGPVFSGLRE